MNSTYDDFTTATPTARTPFVFATDEQNTALWLFVFVTAAVGIIANPIVFIVIAKTKCLREIPFNIILMSLCVSDFMSAAVSPIMYYKSGLVPRDFNLPEWTCKIAVAFDNWTTVSTVHHILAIVIYRVMGLKRRRSLQKFTSTHAAILVCVVWVETFATSGWYPIVGMEIYEASKPYRRSCFLSQKWVTYAMYYSRYYLPFAFFIPMVLIIILSGYILLIIIKIRKYFKRRKEAADLKRENRALLQICFIVGSFIIGYTPELVFRIAILQGYDLGLTVYSYDFFRFILLRLSESLNPFFYTLCSKSIRAAAVLFLRRLCCRGSQSPIGSDESPTSKPDNNGGDNVDKFYNQSFEGL